MGEVKPSHIHTVSDHTLQNRQWLGREVKVLIEEPDAEPGLYVGRTYADAPEVDGQVFVRSRRERMPGEFLKARVVDTYEYDLVAEAIE